MHRDRKRGNILITANGAKLLDWTSGWQRHLLRSVSLSLKQQRPAHSDHDRCRVKSPVKALTQPGTLVRTFQRMVSEVPNGS